MPRTPSVRERLRKKLVMPELTGLRRADAQVMLTNLGFGQGRVRFVESYKGVGDVVHQHPMKGQLVDSNTEVELHVAKRNYVQYLPQVYQVETSTGNSFLREFLWVFQHIQESVTTKLDDGHQYFDPRDTPQEFLPWLASWVALTLDVDWPTVKKRKMIRAAAEMYKYRGTRRAMIEVLEIFVGERPRIEENAWPYAGFRIGVSSTLGEDTIILPPMDMDHCFMVHIPMAPEAITEEMVVKVHNIIKLEKPAHTTYFLQFERKEDKPKPLPFFQIGVSALGVDDVRYDETEPAPAAEPARTTVSKSGDAKPAEPKKPAVEVGQTRKSPAKPAAKTPAKSKAKPKTKAKASPRKGKSSPGKKKET
ncbi:MAG: phage tail-like protein [Myxococcota bacterium]|jgi:phage tail-like protein